MLHTHVYLTYLDAVVYKQAARPKQHCLRFKGRGGADVCVRVRVSRSLQQLRTVSSHVYRKHDVTVFQL